MAPNSKVRKECLRESGKGLAVLSLSHQQVCERYAPDTRFSPCVSYSDSTVSRSLGTFRISLGWTSQKASKVVRQESGAVYYGISDSAGS